jgi:hypothetical protein
MDLENKKTQKNIAIVAVLAAIGYYMFFTKTDENGGTNDPTGNTGAGAGTFNAKTIAEILYDAMKDSGTDETAIFKALGTLSPEQYNQVRLAFGRRSYNATLGNQYNLPTWSPFYSPLPLVDLKGWLKSELSERMYNTLRLKFPSYL